MHIKAFRLQEKKSTTCIYMKGDVNRLTSLEKCLQIKGILSASGGGKKTLIFKWLIIDLQFHVLSHPGYLLKHISSPEQGRHGVNVKKKKNPPPPPPIQPTKTFGYGEIDLPLKVSPAR